MDLINREYVISIATSSCLDLDRYDDTEEFCNEVKELPPAFEGMTNGEVIQALFPNADYESRANFMHITSANICGVTFFWDWWNAPYKAESEE